MERGRDQRRNFLCTQRICWPVNSKLLSLTALANVQRFDATHTVRHVFLAPYTDIHEPTPGNFPGANTATIVFTSGEKIKHPVTAGPGSISISAHFHVSPKKPKKGCFLGGELDGKTWLIIHQDYGAQTCAALTLISPWRKSKRRQCKQPQLAWW